MNLRKALTIAGRGTVAPETRLGSVAESRASDDAVAKPGGGAKAERSNSANLAILQVTRGMLTRTIAMLK
ncbi:MAG: hypothetical protein JOZ42_15490 [Acetobacteraceae bacterium]|nr:hypothetical protein [Acetobacteraceae bacterium]